MLFQLFGPVLYSAYVYGSSQIVGACSLGPPDRLVPTRVPTPLEKLSYHSIHYDLSSPRFETKLDRAASESTFDLKIIEEYKYQVHSSEAVLTKP